MLIYFSLFLLTFVLTIITLITMIKKLLLTTFIGLGLNSIAQTTSFSLMYHFPAVTPSTGVVDPSPTPTAVGITSGSYNAVGTGSTPSTSNVFSFNGWGTGSFPGGTTAPSAFTGSIDLAKYYEIVLTPQAGYSVNLTSMSFGAFRSGTGVRNWGVRTNKDSYATNASASYTPLGAAASHSVPVISVTGGNTFLWNDDALTTGAPSYATNNICKVLFSGANYTNQTTPFNIRVYAWNAEAGTGTFRIDTVVISGSSTFSLGTGLNKISHDLNAKIQLYPNPAINGVANIKITDVTATKIELINALGNILATQQIGKENDIQLDVTNLPVGTYFVKIQTTEGIKTEKLIISK